MFKKIILDTPFDIYNQLTSLTGFEEITAGRYGAVIGDYIPQKFPLVRTTTKYENASQKFMPIHYELIEKIKSSSGITDLELNNALIEIYGSKYRSMGFHSDQALDLANDSYICIYSCYDNPVDLRKLIIKNKSTNEITEIIMEHNSVIIFDMKTNSEHLHKIILDKITTDTKWCGITFRLSKTLIEFKDGDVYFVSSRKKLRVIDDDKEKKEFYKLRSEENKSIDFKYPDLDYTVSPSDLMIC